MPVCPSVRSSALPSLSPSPFGFEMTLQVQKVEIEATAQALDLAPLARLIDRVAGRRVPAAKAAAALGAALAVIADRHEREPVRVAYSLELRRRAKLDRQRARQLRDGEDAPALSPADLKALGKADAVEAKAVKGKRGAPSIRAKAARMRIEVGEALAVRAETRRADLRLAQTLELDAAREGEPVDRVLEAKRGGGNKRLRTRDGLKLLHERGAFTPRGEDGQARRDLAARIEADRLLAIGLRYRDRYEIAAASLKSCLDTDQQPKREVTLWTQARAAQRRAALANQVRVLDIAVVTRLGEEALLALRMVAGEARTVNSITPSGRRRTRLAAALAAALAVVGDQLGQGVDGRSN